MFLNEKINSFFLLCCLLARKQLTLLTTNHRKYFFCCWKNALIGLVSLNWFCCPNVLVSFGILWNWKGKCVANFGCWCGFAFKFYVMDESLRKFRSSKGELRFLLWNVLKIDSRSSFLAKFSNLVALKLVKRNKGLVTWS